MWNETISQDTTILILHRLFETGPEEQQVSEEERTVLLRRLISQLTMAASHQKKQEERSRKGYYSGDDEADKQHFFQSVVAYCSSALCCVDEDVTPVEWALLQCALSTAYMWCMDGKKSENLRRSIVCGQAALRLLTQMAYPFEWAATHVTLGEAYRKASAYFDLQELYSGRSVMQEQAIRHLEAARKVYAQQRYPLQWARTQHSLGLVYLDCVQDGRHENLRRARICFEASLQVINHEYAAYDWTRHELVAKE